MIRLQIIHEQPCRGAVELSGKRKKQVEEDNGLSGVKMGFKWEEDRQKEREIHLSNVPRIESKLCTAVSSTCVFVRLKRERAC